MNLNNNAIFQIVGPSGSGKTHFVCKLLGTSNIFKHKINKIYWHHGCESESGDTAECLRHLKNITFIKGFNDKWINQPKQYDALVIDDLFEEANREKNFNSLFTKIARHREVTVIYITQNLFFQGGNHRTRNLNVHYLIIFKNPRDQTAIDYIARQSFPNNRKFLIDAYNDAVNDKPHGYLFMDFTQNCPDDLRVKSDIFNPSGVVIYKQTHK